MYCARNLMTSARSLTAPIALIRGTTATEIENTACGKLFSDEAIARHIIAAASSSSRNRPRGNFRQHVVDVFLAHLVKNARAGRGGRDAVHRNVAMASSLPNDFVIAITAAFDAEYAEAFGLPSLPATDAMLTMRP